jgi:hypothetical protein
MRGGVIGRVANLLNAECLNQLGWLTTPADALDESRDRFTVATGVLGRLAKLFGVP